MPEPDEIVREIDELSVAVCALVDELGVAGEIRDLDFLLFQHQLNEDEGSADRVLSRIRELRLFHEASSHLLGVFLASMSMRNPALARAATEGVRALVRQKLADPPGFGKSAGDPGEDNAEPDGAGGEG